MQVRVGARERQESSLGILEIVAAGVATVVTTRVPGRASVYLDNTVIVHDMDRVGKQKKLWGK